MKKASEEILLIILVRKKNREKLKTSWPLKNRSIMVSIKYYDSSNGQNLLAVVMTHYERISKAFTALRDREIESAWTSQPEKKLMGVQCER